MRTSCPSKTLQFNLFVYAWVWLSSEYVFEWYPCFDQWASKNQVQKRVMQKNGHNRWGIRQHKVQHLCWRPAILLHWDLLKRRPFFVDYNFGPVQQEPIFKNPQLCLQKCWLRPEIDRRSGLENWEIHKLYEIPRLQRQEADVAGLKLHSGYGSVRAGRSILNSAKSLAKLDIQEKDNLQ